MNDNIGVYMYGDNAVKSMSIVSRLDDYTISIKGYYEENVIIKNPKNLSNIIEVYKQLEETQRTLNN